jgi:cytochrome c-type biogenesis protein CcsB
MVWIINLTVALYAMGLLHSLLGFYQKRQIFVRIALGMVTGGFASHTLLLILIGFQKRHLPLTNLSEALCFFAWCITLTFVIANFRYKTNVLGAFILPLVSVMTVSSQLLWEENHTIPPLLKSKWIYIHSTVAFLAYAAFFLTFISGVLYLIQEKELKNKRFRFLYFRLPSLQVCDDLLHRSLYVGFIFMSITILTGALWAQQAWGHFWSWDPKETASLISWGIYLFLLNYKFTAHWSCRRAAYLSIIGFISILFTFAVNWGRHTYL